MYSLVIENGRVVFGDKRKSEIMNIGISGDKIIKISKEKLVGEKVIDASGKIVSPGFIDPHAHSDLAPFFSGNHTSKLYQGVTTEINGNCGIGLVPLGEKFKEEGRSYIHSHFILPEDEEEIFNLKTTKNLLNSVNEKGFMINEGYLLASGNLRINSVGFSSEHLNEEELSHMLETLDRELENGAYGVSFGLIYQPGNFIDSNEITEILKVVARHDKVASFHMRNEGENVFEAVREVIDCGGKSGCRVNISHFKIMAKRLWGEAPNLLKMVEQAEKEGVRITFDQYPYIASSTTLMVMLPERLFDGDVNKFIELIPRLTKEDKDEITGLMEKRGGPGCVLVTRTYLDNNLYGGKKIEEISRILNLSPVDTVLYLIKESVGRADAIYFSMNEGDMLEIMKHPLGTIGSDGYSYPNEYSTKFGVTHPRSFNTFPRFIEINKKYKLFTLEEMINRITLKPAVNFNIKNRGKIEEGWFADITIFDYDKIKDNSNFDESYIRPRGINYVIVNGSIALEEGEYVGTRSGRGI